MSTYTEGIVELRQLLSDDKTDKRASRKKVIGDIDGTNTHFRTYDKRIIADTFQVFSGDDEITDSASLDDAISGEFTLSSPPDKNTKLTASYYFHWWTDTELQNFLNKGAESIGIDDPNHTSGGDADQAYLQIPQGLRSAALYYAAGHAQKKLIQYMMNRRHSGEFQLEQDKGGDEGFAAIITQMRSEMKDNFKQADTFRDDFYKRQGRRNAPVVRIKTGRTQRYGPFR